MIIKRCRPDDRLKDIYVEAFPPEERREWDDMPVNDDAFAFYALIDNGRDSIFEIVDNLDKSWCKPDLFNCPECVVGLVTVWHFDAFRYIEHLAVSPSQRGRGIGAGVLSALEGPLLLEVEPEETGEIACRRIAFYQRNGFHLLDADYVQPPYSPGLPEVPLKLMARGDIGDVRLAICTLHSRVYGRTV